MMMKQARAYAMQLQLSEAEDLLTETLSEEYDTDDELTALAFFDVNLDAENPEGTRERTRSK